MTKVAVSGAAGRMGATVVNAVESADDLTLSGKADPAFDTPLAAVLEEADVVVDFSVPATALANVEEACAIIGTELARLRSEPVSAEELHRAKESVKGRLVLSSESTAARMTRISRATLFGLPIEELDEMLAKVDAVEVDQLTELAAELYAEDKLSAACVGTDEDRFRAALAPVSEALVAA